MSAPTLPAPLPAPPAAPRTTAPATRPATRPALDAFRAERIKLTTLRSLWIPPLVALALTAGVTTAIGASLGDKDDSLTVDPGVGVFYGLNFGQAALICFGILLIGQEFNTRMIDASLTAVPRRGRLYGAKLALGALVGLTVGALATAGAFAGYAATAPGGWDGPAFVRAAVAGVLYQTLLVVLCLGTTALLGNLTAAMGLLVPSLFLLSPLLSGVPGVRRVVQFLPDRAGQYALRYADDPQVGYGHWTGLLIMALWTALAAYGGLRALRRAR
ncbi:ABC transporter permease [Kitasatospora sp. NPDC004799]|uniref:ABC transporter permease n=1 Tax=Kitasatospora sp. NPDC004799 TaxID=3154460 RepID=UPI0033B381F4